MVSHVLAAWLLTLPSFCWCWLKRSQKIERPIILLGHLLWVYESSAEAARWQQVRFRVNDQQLPFPCADPIDDVSASIIVPTDWKEQGPWLKLQPASCEFMFRPGLLVLRRAFQSQADWNACFPAAMEATAADIRASSTTLVSHCRRWLCGRRLLRKQSGHARKVVAQTWTLRGGVQFSDGRAWRMWRHVPPPGAGQGGVDRCICSVRCCVQWLWCGCTSRLSLRSAPLCQAAPPFHL